MDPPNGDEAVAETAAFSNGIVTRDVQAFEARNSPGTSRMTREDLEYNDIWIRPWAVRPASSHSTSNNPDKLHVRIDPDKFAIHPSMSLVDTIKGSFHSTDYHNLRSIVKNGVLPRTDVADSSSGRLHSHFGVFAPRDRHNNITKYRVHAFGASLRNNPRSRTAWRHIDRKRHDDRQSSSSVEVCQGGLVLHS